MGSYLRGCLLDNPGSRAGGEGRLFDRVLFRGGRCYIDFTIVTPMIPKAEVTLRVL